MMSNEDMTKDLTIQVRCSAEERDAWSKAAEADARPLSAWIRLQCNTAATEATKKVAERKPTKKSGR